MLEEKFWELHSLGDSQYVGGGTYKKDILSLRTMNAMDDFRALFMPKTTSGYRKKEKEFHGLNVQDTRNHPRIVGSEGAFAAYVSFFESRLWTDLSCFSTSGPTPRRRRLRSLPASSAPPRPRAPPGSSPAGRTIPTPPPSSLHDIPFVLWKHKLTCH